MKSSTVRKAFCAVALALLCTVPVYGRAAKARWKVYTNKRFNLQFLAPVGWQVSDQRTHPSILVALRHASGASVRLSVKLMTARISLMAFARSDVQASRQVGFKVGKLEPAKLAGQPALRVEGRHPKKARGFVQYFVMRGKVGFVLTYAYPLAKRKLLARSFELVVLSFKFTDKK